MPAIMMTGPGTIHSDNQRVLGKESSGADDVRDDTVYQNTDLRKGVRNSHILVHPELDLVQRKQEARGGRKRARGDMEAE